MVLFKAHDTLCHSELVVDDPALLADLLAQPLVIPALLFDRLLNLSDFVGQLLIQFLFD